MSFQKKFFYLVVAFLMLLVCVMPLAACADQGGSDDDSDKDKENVGPAWKDIRSDDFLSLPIMTIDIDCGSPLSEVNREDYVNTHISIKNTSSEYSQDNLPAEFRGRGHGTWRYDKKGYRIKYASKQSLFGLPANKHWALFAAATDDSFLRNALAFEITNQVLDNIEYTSSATFIELFVNGDYHGVYQIFEYVRVDKARVNIDSEIGVLDTGYLLEYDAYAEGREGIDYFPVAGLKYPFSVKSPDPDDVVAENEAIFRAQVRYVQSYMQTVVDAALFNDFELFLQLTDIGSVVDIYIINELFKNADAGWGSFFMYKKAGDKLFFGPVWDFDLSAGQSYNSTDPYGIYVAEEVLQDTSYTANEIFIALMKNADFKEMVKNRWAVVSPQIPSVITSYVGSVQPYADSLDRNKIRWGDNQWQIKQVEVENWLLQRIEWLDEEWAI